MFDDWVPPSRTLILERPIAEVQASLADMNLPPMPLDALMKFKLLEGRRADWRAMFDERAAELWAFLLPDVPFNEERHRELCGMVITPPPVVPVTMGRVIKELRDGL